MIISKTTWLIMGVPGILGLSSYLFVEDRVFPEANLGKTISHQEAQQQALDYLTERGVDVKAYNVATVFDSSEMAKIFLQRVWGTKRLNEEMTNNPDLVIWGFSTRLFQLEQEEEYLVRVDTRGNIIFYNHIIPNQQAGDQVPHEAAQQQVEDFAVASFGWDLAEFELKYANQSELENRTDHVFLYEKKSTQVRWKSEETSGYGAEQWQFIIRGSELGMFGKFFSAPQDFAFAYEQESSSGGFYWALARAPEFLFGLASILIIFRRYRQQDVYFRYFIYLAIGLSVFSLLEPLTLLESETYHYPKDSPLLPYLLNSIIGMTRSVLLFGILDILIIGCAGESLARQYFTKTNQFHPHSPLSLRSLMAVTSLGILLGVFSLGGTHSFYWIANEYFDVWSTMSSSMSSLMSSPFPFFTGVVSSLEASLSEELMFRLFAIALCKKFLKKDWIAIVIPAVVWAFLHSPYPVYPQYVRGIELTLVGCLWGYFFIRYGLLSTIVAHYVFNAILYATPLLKSGNGYLQFSGVILLGCVILIPLMHSGFQRMRLGKAVSLSESRSTVASSASTHHLAVNSKHLLSGITGIGLLGLIVFYIWGNNAFFQNYLNLQITHHQAEQIALDYLAQRSWPTDDFQTSTVLEAYGLDQEFYQITWGPLKFYDKIAQNPDFTLWRYSVRFFKPGSIEGYSVGVDTLGRIRSMRYSQPDQAAGAFLNEAQAREKLAQFAEALNVDLALYDEKHYSSQRLENRSNHYFDFELRGSEIAWSDDSQAEKAKDRFYLRIDGEQLAAFTFYFETPEDFIRDREKAEVYESVFETVASLGRTLLIGLAFLVLLQAYRDQQIQWWGMVYWGIILMAASALAQVARVGSLFHGYPTDHTMVNFLTQEILGGLQDTVMILLILLLKGMAGIAATESVFPQANHFHPTHVLSWKGVGLATWKGMMFGGLFLGYVTLFHWMASEHLGMWTFVGSDYLPSAFPFFNHMAMALIGAITQEFIFRYFAISFFKKYLKSTAMAIVIPALIWSFWHYYAVHPKWLIGTELFFIGVFWGTFSLNMAFSPVSLLIILVCRWGSFGRP